MRLLPAAGLFAVMLSTGGAASATLVTVDFTTDVPGTLNDPAALLPPGWNVGLGFGGVPTAFTGSWTYDSSVPDLNSNPRVGEFLFSDPSLTMKLDAGGIAYEFELDRITFSYSDVPGEWSFYEIFGSSTSSPIAGVTSEEIHVFWGQMSPLPSALIPGVDSVDPLPGSPWEDASGFSNLYVSGSTPSASYSFSKLLGSYGEGHAAVPEPTSALLFASGLLVLARCRSVGTSRSQGA